MRIAILSDIHSNKYAFLKAIELIDQNKIDKLIFLGDFFGYYPWARETFELLHELPIHSISILGNHDVLVRDKVRLPNPLPGFQQLRGPSMNILIKLTCLIGLEYHYVR